MCFATTGSRGPVSVLQLCGGLLQHFDVEADAAALQSDDEDRADEVDSPGRRPAVDIAVALLFPGDGPGIEFPQLREEDLIVVFDSSRDIGIGASATGRQDLGGIAR